MTRIILKEIELLKEMILRLAVDVEDRLQKAMDAVRNRDEAAARDIVALDAEIDAREVRIEEECLKVLALHQPVASDLRFVIFVLKVDNDLERIGDLAANIAKRAQLLIQAPRHAVEARIEAIADVARGMLHQVIEAVVNLDPAAATAVCARDDTVDAMHREVYGMVLNRLNSADGMAEAGVLLPLQGVSKELERVADHVTNIAEDLLYLTEGSVVRHRTGEARPNPPAV